MNRIKSTSSASWAIDRSKSNGSVSTVVDDEETYVPEWIRLNQITWTTDSENDKWFQTTHDMILIRRAVDETIKEKNKRERWLHDKNVIFCWTYVLEIFLTIYSLQKSLEHHTGTLLPKVLCFKL